MIKEEIIVSKERVPVRNHGKTPILDGQDKFDKAVELHQQGELDQAQGLYEDVLKTQPGHFDSLHLLGVIACQRSDYQRAVDLIDKAINIFSCNAAFYSNRGFALMGLKEWDEAIASYNMAVAIKPDYAEAYNNRGNALTEQGGLEEAVASYDKAISIRPDYAEAYNNRGNALKELERFDDALASCEKAIAIRPDYAEAYNNRGNVFIRLRRFNDAIASYDRAIAIRPDYAEACCNRGNALMALGELEEAIAFYDKAIGIDPEYADAYINYGMAILELKQYHSAIESYDKAISINPDLPEAYFNKSIALLSRGEFQHGWELYEWRWECRYLRSHKRAFPQPLWLGRESLKNKTILLHSEQGQGDTIQFCRYAGLVAGLGARVIMELPESLAGLLKDLEGVDEVVVKGDMLPYFDFHCPLLSLPLAFKTNLESIPFPHAYINSSADKVRDWSNRLGIKKKSRVGLVWSGSTIHENDRNRSIKLAQLLPLLPNSVEYVSLQKEVREVDEEALQGQGNIRDYREEIRDFADTAALCELMDLVISVDTSAAHLAGALGKPTWVLLPFCPDWRWLLDREDSVWYPSVKLYRQGSIGDWTGVFERVHADLIKLLS